jgi:hypothetical protein
MEDNNSAIESKGEKFCVGQEFKFSNNISLFAVDVTDIYCINAVIEKLLELHDNFGWDTLKETLNNSETF